jgi:predicted HicB family RNase H-like nuclease
MDKVFKHKGYSGSVEPDLDSGTLRGEVLFVTDTLLYEGRTIDALEKAFRATVDQYLALCRARGVEPKKPFKGSVTVRIGETLHEKAALDAARRGQTLNQWMTDAVALRTDGVAESKPGRGKSRTPRKSGKAKTLQGKTAWTR